MRARTVLRATLLIFFSLIPEFLPPALRVSLRATRLTCFRLDAIIAFYVREPVLRQSIYVPLVFAHVYDQTWHPV